MIRVNGHYGMVTGLLNGGLGLGAMVGPIMSGAVTDATDFTWTLTVLSFLDMLIVSILTISKLQVIFFYRRELLVTLPCI